MATPQRNTTRFCVENQGLFVQKIQNWANKHFQQLVCLDSNEQTADHYRRFEAVIACGCRQHFRFVDDCIPQLQAMQRNNPDWLFGYVSYDLKNEIEALKSENFDGLDFSITHFFQPEYVFTVLGNEIHCHHFEADVMPVWNAISSIEIKKEAAPEALGLKIEQRLSAEEYAEKFAFIQQKIREGEVYEMNFCFEFFAENAKLTPYELYPLLMEKTLAPFSVFWQFDDEYLLCASPERYLQKSGSRLISQPIKGTRKRALSNFEEDERLKKELQNDSKERSENVMIVDLVRNDFHRFCRSGSVQVDELCAIYSFRTVHQMISTVSGQVPAETTFADCLCSTFPMGSMTGAPKIAAMQLIEQVEKSRRGLYSGAVGYLTPEGDFDFNVVIRSLVYNAEKEYLSLQIGSAITIESEAKSEYEECLLKAQALLGVLG